MEEKNVEKETNTKKSFKSKLIDVLIIIVIVLVGLFMYAKYLEPKTLVIRETRLVENEIPLSYSGVKLVFFSDLLLGSSVGTDELENVVNNIKELKPDILVYGGNLIYKETDDKEKIISLLSGIETSIGKYYVTGSLDKDESIEILDKSGFTKLDNNYELLYYKDVTPICLYGVSSYILGNYKLEDMSNCKGYYTIFVSHEPDMINKLSDIEVNLILSGNTLGGELNLPLLSKKYDGSTTYYKEYHENNNMYISNGIGTRTYHLRLFNKPSISLFRFKSTGEK